MSGFASKLSAAGTKGWKDLQSLWSEPKTTLTSADTSPGEKSSLLGKTCQSHGDEPSKGCLLGDESESKGDWGQEVSWSVSRSSSKSNVKVGQPDWPASKDEDLEDWLNTDTSSLSISAKSKHKKKNTENWGDGWKNMESSKTLSSMKSSFTSSKSKKKSHKSLLNESSSEEWEDAEWNTGYSATSTGQTEPLVGNLVDLDDGNDINSSSTADGWHNEVWAADREDKKH